MLILLLALGYLRAVIGATNFLSSVKFPAWIGPTDFTFGEIASPRFGLGFASLNDTLYVFGGYNAGNICICS